jgi:hypothetical protein
MDPKNILGMYTSGEVSHIRVALFQDNLNSYESQQQSSSKTAVSSKEHLEGFKKCFIYL